MITEIIRFNCHILDTKKHPDGTTPETIKSHYNIDPHMNYMDTDVIIDTINWDSSKSTIITKVKRVDS